MYLTPGTCPTPTIPTPYSREPEHQTLSSTQGIVQQSSLVSFSTALSGEFVLLTQTIQGPGDLTVDGNLVTAGLAVTGTAHDIAINVDGTDVVSNLITSPPASGILATAHYSAVVAAGSHTVELRYFTATTGLGTDFLSNMNLRSEVC